MRAAILAAVWLASNAASRAAVVHADETPALVVTDGHATAIGPHRFRVDDPELRGVLDRGDGHAATLRFVYLGPSRTQVPLASGEHRIQIGLKLVARDTCNLVYVMWHVAPTPGIAVSVKRNEGAATHAECGARGYLNVSPTRSTQAPGLVAGAPHELAASLTGRDLRVTADGVVVWQGTLPPEVDDLRGPAGVRSDNGIYELELRIPPATRVGTPRRHVL